MQASWAQAEALGLATVGALFFDALFATSASAEQLFATQKFADGPAGRARFKLHTLNVMQAPRHHYRHRRRHRSRYRRHLTVAPPLPRRR